MMIEQFFQNYCSISIRKVRSSWKLWGRRKMTNFKRKWRKSFNNLIIWRMLPIWLDWLNLHLFNIKKVKRSIKEANTFRTFKSAFLITMGYGAKSRSINWVGKKLRIMTSTILKMMIKLEKQSLNSLVWSYYF